MKVPTCSQDGGQSGKCGIAQVEANSQKPASLWVFVYL